MRSQITVRVASIVAGLSSAMLCASLASASESPARAADGAPVSTRTLGSGMEYTLVAQATPSWGPVENRGSALPRSPDAVNRMAATPNAAAANINQAPKDRDCKSVVSRPEQNYQSSFTKWSTDGTEDHGQILNIVNGAARLVQSDLEDVQVRIEQMRCEEQNIKAKLDYIIRRMP
jgi:hypothetical protein